MGAFKVVVLPRAQADLRSAVEYVARAAGAEVATRFGDTLVDRALSLADLPHRGRVVPELKNAAVREIFFKSYRIVYSVRGSVVEIWRFWHAARGTPEIDSDEFSSTPRQA